MSWLSDDAVARLRDAANEPDLSGTPYRFAGRWDAAGWALCFSWKIRGSGGAWR